jgi:phytoene/squalene synthetase
MERHGVTESQLDARRAGPALRSLLREQVAWARELFAAGMPLAGLAPPALRPAIGMFVAGGRAVADAIERADYDTLARRPTVGKWTKLRLAARAWWALQTTGGGTAGGVRGGVGT